LFENPYKTLKSFISKIVILKLNYKQLISWCWFVWSFDYDSVNYAVIKPNRHILTKK